ncbi:MAG: hypothetical protein ACI8ZF_000349 [Candidatus Midichloriaceae bacterium]|jgi:hypothetical protein
MPKGRGSVLDALNRSTENGGETKFRRHFDSSIALDPDFAKALRNQQADMKEVMKECKKDLLELMEKDPKIAKAVIKSAETLNKRAGKKPLSKWERFKAYGEKMSNEEALDVLTVECDRFISENQKEAESVANLIDVQIKVQELLKEEDAGRRNEIIEEIKDIYKKDKKYLKGKSFDGEVEWVRNDGSKEPIKGNLYEYMEKVGKEAGSKDVAVAALKQQVNDQEKVPAKQEVNQQEDQVPIQQQAEAQRIREEVKNVAHKKPTVRKQAQLGTEQSRNKAGQPGQQRVMSSR